MDELHYDQTENVFVQSKSLDACNKNGERGSHLEQNISCAVCIKSLVYSKQCYLKSYRKYVIHPVMIRASVAYKCQFDRKKV